MSSKHFIALINCFFKNKGISLRSNANDTTPQIARIRISLDQAKKYIRLQTPRSQVLSAPIGKLASASLVQELFPAFSNPFWVNQRSLADLCGSSQQLMYGLVLDSTSPLYGRADVILKITPIKLPYIQQALNLSDVEAVEEYAVWGGVPRYWELREDDKNLLDSVKRNLLSVNGTLYEEPMKLFKDDMNDIVKTATIMSYVGLGANKLSEIAGRCGEVSTNLSRTEKIEIDVVAESLDKKYLLVGECKWTVGENADRLMSELKAKAEKLPFARNHIIVAKLFSKNQPLGVSKDVLLPGDVIHLMGQ